MKKDTPLMFGMTDEMILTIMTVAELVKILIVLDPELELPGSTTVNKLALMATLIDAMEKRS